MRALFAAVIPLFALMLCAAISQSAHLCNCKLTGQQQTREYRLTHRMLQSAVCSIGVVSSSLNRLSVASLAKMKLKLSNSQSNAFERQLRDAITNSFLLSFVPSITISLFFCQFSSFAESLVRIFFCETRKKQPESWQLGEISQH